MKLKAKTIWAIVLCVFIVLFVIPLGINILFKGNSGICFLQSEWDAGDALAFYGAVLSGILTVAGVFLTIRNENNKSKQDDSIKYKPILELDGVDLDKICRYREVGLHYSISCSNDDPNLEQIQKKFGENLCGKHPKYKLFFKNIGRGETFNASLESFEVYRTNWDDKSDIHSRYSTSQYIGEIYKDRYLGVYIYLPDYLLLPKDASKVDYFDLCTKLSIIYSDMFDRMKYKFILYMNHKITIVGDEEITPNVKYNDYHYVKVKYELCNPMPSKMIFSKKQGKFIDEYEYVIE